MKVLETLSAVSPVSGSTGKPVTLRIEDVLNAMEDGLIRPYGNNRGDGSVAKETSSSVRTLFHPPAFGASHVSRLKGESFFRFVDSNSRWHGLLQRRRDGLLTKKESDEDVTFLVVHENDFLTAYAILNAQKAHSGQVKVTNPDLPAGSYIHDLLADAAFEHFSHKHWLNLCDIIHSFVRGFDDADGVDGLFSVFRSRHEFTNLLVNNKESFEKLVPKRDRADIVKAIAFYKQVLEGAREYMGTSPGDYKALINSSGFAIFILTNYLMGGALANRDPGKIGMFAVTRGKKIIELCQRVARRNKKTIGQRDFEEIERILIGDFKGVNATKALARKRRQQTDEKGSLDSDLERNRRSASVTFQSPQMHDSVDP